MNKSKVLEQFRRGDQAILGRLYAEDRQNFVRWMKVNRNLDQQEALDIFQNAIVITYDNVVTGKLTELSSKLSTYIFSVGNNIAKERERIKMRENKSLSQHIIEHLEKDHVVFNQKFELMLQALEEIGNPCKELLVYQYFKRKKLSEIATLLNYKNTDTVKTKKYKCVRRIREIMVRLYSENEINK